MSDFAAILMASPAWRLFVALAIGLLIGVERERHNGEGVRRAPQGVRTFALCALLGGVTAQVGSVGLIVAGAVFTVLAAITSYWRSPREDLGLTTEAALVVTFALGVLSGSQPALALGVGVCVTVLLAARDPLHRFVRNVLTRQELLDGVAFTVAAVVVLPLLPNHPIDPWGMINPFAFWRMVVVLMGFSAAGYWATRLVGPRFGLVAAGFSSGFISSSIGIATMSARAHSSPPLARVAATGAVASVLGSLVYLVALVITADAYLMGRLFLPFGCAVAFTLCYAAALTWRARTSTEADVSPGRAFDIRTILIFVTLVVLFGVLSTFLVSRFGQGGVLFSAAATGLVDAHATSVSIATLIATGNVAAGPGALAILIGLTTNMAIKIPAAFALGPRMFGVQVSAGLALLLIGLWCGYFLDGLFLQH